MDPRPSVSPISALRKRSPSDPDLEDGDACTNLGAVKVSAGTAANLTMTTKATFPAHTGEVSIATGTGDGASYTTYSSALKVWNGLGLLDNAGAVKGYWDARNGVLDTKGGFKVDGQSIDDRFAKLAGASFGEAVGNVLNGLARLDPALSDQRKRTTAQSRQRVRPPQRK
jgi:hypothetical protein